MNEKRAEADLRRPLIGTNPPRCYSKQLGYARLAIGLVTVLSILAYCHYNDPGKPHPLKADVLGKDKNKDKEPDQWSWSNIEPSRDLKWEPCHDMFECARLDVPMDWQHPSDDKRVVLGIIKLPAKKDPGKLSPLIVNPGGPGGSGIAFVRKAGTLLQTIVGDNHDVISFDPRGVGVSTPRVECWGSSSRRKLWGLGDPGVVDEHDGLIYSLYARSAAYSRACEAANNATGILEHVSTPYHARDMLHILDKTGHARLRYWGFSYGTVLGGTFAALFPDRVERLVSDGNCDYHDWWKLDHMKFLTDTDRIFDGFDEACHGVGPDKCAFWAPSPQAVQDRRRDLLEGLKRRPVPVVLENSYSTDNNDLPELVTYSALQRLTQTSLYKPFSKFPALAAVYAALERGDAGPYVDMVRPHSRRTPEDNNGGNPDQEKDQLCGVDDVPATMPHEKGQEEDAFPAIMCADGVPVAADAPDAMAAYAARMQSQSRWAGAVNVLFHVLCAGKTVRPKWEFSDDNFTGTDTAHPILYIGNMADNVTPFASAVNNSARFPSSVVLKQNSYGHCSLAAPSKCTARHLRNYFQRGVLPAAGAECEADYGLFELPQDGSAEAVAAEQDELAGAMLQLARDVDLPRPFH